MEYLRIGDFGQIEGFPQHDATIKNINLKDGAVEFQLATSDGSIVKVNFNHVVRMVINNLREGNIVDRFYLWHFTDVPKSVKNKLNVLFGNSELEMISDGGFVLSMESSYGAELFGLVQYNGDLIHYLNQL